jgi:hypothetical protein
MFWKSCASDEPETLLYEMKIECGEVICSWEPSRAERDLMIQPSEDSLWQSCCVLEHCVKE